MIDFLLVWWLRTGRYWWSRLRRRLFERRYLSTTLPTVNSLGDIEACLGEVTWTKDGLVHLFDCISYPQTTWVKKKDDCDGFASLAAALLAQWDPGCRPLLVTALLRPVRQSHTVCAFTVATGGLWFFDNASLRRDAFPTHRDIAGQLSRRGERMVCWDVRDPVTLALVEFHRS